MMTTHSFHIPVMGTAFTIDTQLRVAPFGIDSAISLVDDILMETLRKMYCEKFNLPYHEININSNDHMPKESPLILISSRNWWKKGSCTAKHLASLSTFTNNLNESISYYQAIAPKF